MKDFNFFSIALKVIKAGYLCNFKLFRFCAINALVIYVYTSSYQGVDEEEFGGLWEITKEGFVTSFAGFLVRIYENFVIFTNLIKKLH